jgi:hypothetical protein
MPPKHYYASEAGATGQRRHGLIRLADHFRVNAVPLALMLSVLMQ